MSKRSGGPGQIHLRIIEVTKRFPEGISGGQIRQELEKEGLRPEDQTHLDRRKRDLKKWYIIEKIKSLVCRLSVRPRRRSHSLKDDARATRGALGPQIIPPTHDAAKVPPFRLGVNHGQFLRRCLTGGKSRCYNICKYGRSR